MIINSEQRKELQQLYHNARVNTAAMNFFNLMLAVSTTLLIINTYQFHFEWYIVLFIAIGVFFLWRIIAFFFGRCVVSFVSFSQRIKNE